MCQYTSVTGKEEKKAGGIFPFFSPIVLRGVYQQAGTASPFVRKLKVELQA